LAGGEERFVPEAGPTPGGGEPIFVFFKKGGGAGFCFGFRGPEREKNLVWVAVPVGINGLGTAPKLGRILPDPGDPRFPDKTGPGRQF